MPPDVPLLPFAFTVRGVPASHQSNNRVGVATWKTKVTTAAAAEWTAYPIAAGDLQILVTYYHEAGDDRIDVDNMLKPIQDALIGIVYDDDARVTVAVAEKRSIDNPYFVRYLSRPLLEAFHVGDPFVHVIIDHAPDPRTLPRTRT